MNDIRPFRGLRFNEEIVGPLGEVLCPPYDIISPLEQVALYGRSRYNAVRLELGFEFPEDDADNNRYTRARATLDRWLSEEALRAEGEPALYLYEQQFAQEGKPVARRGVLARLRLTPWEEGVVLPHEETMPGPKEDRLRLMLATECNLSPLFLLFDDPTGTVRRLMDEVAGDRSEAFSADTGDGQSHRLWVAGGTKQARLAEALREVRLYMADGHHRYETALTYREERRSTLIPGSSPTKGEGREEPLFPPVGEGAEDEGAPYDFALVLLVDARDPGLVVLPTHRLVRGIDPGRLSALDGALPALFEVEKVGVAGETGSPAEELLARMRERHTEGHVLGIYRPGSSGAAVLRLREPVERMPGARPLLDVDVLHDLLLAPLGIGQEQLRLGNQVRYTREAAEAVAAVDHGDVQVAFLLNPTGVDEVLETARARGKMPQKSTYFYPKAATGLVINPLS